MSTVRVTFPVMQVAGNFVELHVRHCLPAWCVAVVVTNDGWQLSEKKEKNQPRHAVEFWDTPCSWNLKSWDTNKLLQQSTTTAITYNLLPENYETPSTQKRKLKYYVRVNRQSRNQVHEALHRDVPKYNDCSFKPDMQSAYACTTLRFRTIHKHSYGTIILFRQRQQFVRMLFSCTQDTMKWHCLWTTIISRLDCGKIHICLSSKAITCSAQKRARMYRRCNKTYLGKMAD